jgi:hypothetical protein
MLVTELDSTAPLNGVDYPVHNELNSLMQGGPREIFLTLLVILRGRLLSGL